MEDQYNVALDRDQEWLDNRDLAELEAWLDSQEQCYPLPEDLQGDPDYEDDF